MRCASNIRRRHIQKHPIHCKQGKTSLPATNKRLGGGVTVQVDPSCTADGVKEDLKAKENVENDRLSPEVHNFQVHACSEAHFVQ
jgi:hypothetical protein